MSIRLQRRLALPTITLTACVELENTSFTREIIHQKSKLKKMVELTELVDYGRDFNQTMVGFEAHF